jgi:hypothetical protein
MRPFHRISASTIPWCCAAATVLLTCDAHVACAAPITYLYSGIGTGQIGSTAFSSTGFTITAFADTSNITPWGPAVGGPQNTHLTTTIDIANIGSYSITTPSHSWMSGDPIGEGSGGIGANLSFNWISLDDYALSGYGLNTSIGPVLEESSERFDGFKNVLTSGGILTFTSISTVTFAAVLAPEPSTPSLIAMAAIVFVRLRRKSLQI